MLKKTLMSKRDDGTEFGSKTLTLWPFGLLSANFIVSFTLKMLAAEKCCLFRWGVPKRLVSVSVSVLHVNMTKSSSEEDFR